MGVGRGRRDGRAEQGLELAEATLECPEARLERSAVQPLLVQLRPERLVLHLEGDALEARRPRYRRERERWHERRNRGGAGERRVSERLGVGGRRERELLLELGHLLLEHL